MEPRARATAEQFSALIDFMERHGDLSRPQQCLQGRVKSDHHWKHLTDLLNSFGGGVKKPTEKWKKVWADWKTKTKKKCLRLRQQASGTGGGPSTSTLLTALEERVVAVMGLSAVVGQAGIGEHGFNRTPSESHQVNLNSTSSVTIDAGSAIEVHLPTAPEKELHIVSEGHMENFAVELSPYCVPTSPPPPPPPPPSQEPLPRASSHSPFSTSATPRRRSAARRNRGLTPFERVADRFTAIEEARDQRFHEREEARDQRFHELEMERLRLEAERIEVARKQNNLLETLTHLGQQLIHILSNSNHQS